MKANIRYASESDKAFWFSIDRHISETELDIKISINRAYIIEIGGKQIGLFRYNLFWDSLPFLTMIHFKDEYQNKGFGRQAMLHWEQEMLSLGHKVVMTSTQVDELAQHFYRKLGYVDKGSIFFDNTPVSQPQEMIMIKVL